MRKIRLAYRDADRTPVIFCIKEMARRYYDVDVEVCLIKGTEDYENALFDGACDVIIEHLEYLYERAAAAPRLRCSRPRPRAGGWSWWSLRRCAGFFGDDVRIHAGNRRRCAP